MFGDFAEHVSASHGEVRVIRYSPVRQMIGSAAIGVCFTILTMFFLAASRLLVSRYYVMRFFFILVMEFTFIGNYFWDFKMVRPWRNGEWIVMYELPHGPERLLLSLGIGIIVALVITLTLLGFCGGRHPYFCGKAREKPAQ
jgi:hypothetical protein